MEKPEILRKLGNELSQLVMTLSNASDSTFFHQHERGKWSVAQNVQHLVLAIRPLNLAFSLPVFVLAMFGKPRNASTSFDELVKRYQQRLNDGAKASPLFIPRKSAVDRKALINTLIVTYENFRRKIEATPEQVLDLYLLPHPILGKITLREMIFFTVYHIHHHHRIVKERLISGSMA